MMVHAKGNADKISAVGFRVSALCLCLCSVFALLFPVLKSTPEAVTAHACSVVLLYNRM
jgi:hypothetical protein